MRLRAAALLVLVGGSPVAAQPLANLKEAKSLEPRIQTAPAGAECTGGLQYDDGSLENGYRYGTIFPASKFMMRFDLPSGKKRIKAVCVCWSELISDDGVLFNIYFNRADGAGGSPGAQIAAFGPATATSIPAVPKFYRYDLSEFVTEEESIYVGPGRLPALAGITFVCADENGPSTQPGYSSGASVSAPPQSRMGAGGADFFAYKALGVRLEYELVVDPPPPAGPWLTTAAIPAFQFKALITAGANQITPSLESDCLAETLCLSGALPGRSELFARIIGPRPNGFLWVNLVRFTISQVEVWVQRRTGGEIRYYKLPAIPSDSNELTGLVDKQAFTP